MVDEKEAALRRAELMAKEIGHRVMNSLQLVSGHIVRRGKTPVLDPLEAHQLIDAISISTVIGHATARSSASCIGAALGMHVEGVNTQNRRLWLRLHEKGGKQHAMPCHHNLETYLHEFSTVRASQTYGSRDRRHSL